MAGTTLYDPLWEPRMWQGQVWEARPDGASTRGKAKFGKRHGSRKWEEENSSTRRRHRGKGRKRQQTPSPHTMCHTPHWASAGRVAFYYFVFLKRRKCIRGHFLVVFGIRSGPSQRFFRIRRGIRRHPRVRWQICESKWLLFWTLPCDVAASQKSQGLVTIHPDLNFPPRNLLSKLISFETWCVLGPSFVWGYLSSANVCNFIHDRGVSDSREISWLRYHVKTRARRGSSFSQLGLEPKPHRLDSSVTLLLRRVVQSKTQ